MSQASSYACINRAWRAHQAELRAFLIHRARNAEEGDDLLQEVFLKAMLQGQVFCQVDQPRAWLFQVARHLLIDRLPYSVARWLVGEEKELTSLKGIDSGMVIRDIQDRPVLLLSNEWSLRWVEERNPDVKFLAVPQDARRV